MRVLPLFLVLPLLPACTGKTYGYDTGELVDTGVPQCGRVRGTEGILLYQDGGDAVRSPLETPDTYTVTTGVAGPLGDDRTYVAIGNGTAILSEDGGCTWESQGRLPSTSHWQLVSAGTRVYAFDELGASGARSDDFGLTWTPFDTGSAFAGLPVVDIADSTRLRGIQARGVVTSSDGGDTWSLGAALPDGAATLADADLAPSNLDVALIGGPGGAWRTDNAGASWTPVLADVAVTAVAVHPNDPAVFFAIATDADGVTTVSRTGDNGADWARLVDSSQVTLPTDPLLWPIPGDTTSALSAFGPLHNENTDADGVNLYVMQSGTGTHTVFVGTWFHLNQVAYGDDRWVMAADAVTGG
jgi:hypothetical protein